MDPACAGMTIERVAGLPTPDMPALGIGRAEADVTGVGQNARTLVFLRRYGRLVIIAAFAYLSTFLRVDASDGCGVVLGGVACASSRRVAALLAGWAQVGGSSGPGLGRGGVAGPG